MTMKLMRVGDLGHERPVALVDDRHFDMSSLCADIDGSFLSSDGMKKTAAALRAGDLPEVDVSGERIGAPIARPSAVICIGQNYAAHAAESGAEPPAQPIVFLKTPNTVVGPYDDVTIPPGSTRTDWEVELGVVIGRPAYCLGSPDEAMSCIAGYVVSNDVSERDFQIEHSGGQWSKGKCAPTFNPVGPWLVPSTEVLDPQKLGLRSFVNGEPRQDSSSADMIFSVAHIIQDLSQYMALEPGDLVNTGTPEGVALSGRFPYLSTGDIVELEIDGLGRQAQRVV
jgi:2,4-diketo-3-deoxy-L-fuconate hydrolase